jgi:hypothetical protein
LIIGESPDGGKGFDGKPHLGRDIRDGGLRAIVT